MADLTLADLLFPHPAKDVKTATGAGIGTIEKWKAGTTFPRGSRVRSLAALLGLPVHELSRIIRCSRAATLAARRNGSSNG